MVVVTAVEAHVDRRLVAVQVSGPDEGEPREEFQGAENAGPADRRCSLLHALQDDRRAQVVTILGEDRLQHHFPRRRQAITFRPQPLESFAHVTFRLLTHNEYNIAHDGARKESRSVDGERALFSGFVLFQVINCVLQVIFTILESAQASVAGVADDSPWLSTLLIVVND